jgi:formylglycine-generating enzyme required for sulfatase activity
VVLTRGFELGVVPVTQSLYEAVLGENPSAFQGPQRPVECVSWFDAVRFCNALSAAVGLSPAYRIGAGDEDADDPSEHPGVEWDRASPGYRLPTDAEWEYAARAGTSHRFAGGDDARAVAWTEENSGGETRAVGEKAANAWGLHDLSGNVWEWCWDWYGAYPSEPVSDAAGPASGSERVLRGGSWGVSARLARVACRGDASPPGLCLANIGLRLARTVP